MMVTETESGDSIETVDVVSGDLTTVLVDALDGDSEWVLVVTGDDSFRHAEARLRSNVDEGETVIEVEEIVDPDNAGIVNTVVVEGQEASLLVA